MKKLTAATIIQALFVALATVASYAVVGDIVGPAIGWNSGTEQLGGMWAAVSTLFCFRTTYTESIKFGLSRMSATVTSFALCSLYLLILPFSLWGMALIIVVGALTLTVLDRADDIITTSITTVVIFVVTSLSTHDRWAQPLLRLLDTLIGIAIGLLAAWMATQLTSKSKRTSAA